MDQDSDHPVFEIANAGGASPIVVVCEHASAHIPAHFEDLGLSAEARLSHAAWDPGARGVALGLSWRLDAAMVASGISRLVYDCNRPPEHPGTTPPKSEIYDVPGNRNLSEEARQARHDAYYVPFRDAVTATMAQVPSPILVTMHSFTPVYHGVAREVEIGILHAEDARLAEAMLAMAGAHTDHLVLRNEPYGPVDGVTHTVDIHATPQNRPNVMLEVRNDLIATQAQQDAMATQLAGWLRAAVAALGVPA